MALLITYLVGVAAATPTMTLLLKIHSNKALLTSNVGKVNFNPKSKICTVGVSLAKGIAKSFA